MPLLNNPVKIAILGTRGVPAHYGGFETFAEELGSRLVRKGYEVSVYCRKDVTSSDAGEYKGIQRIFQPTVRHKYFETVFHTFVSSVHVMFQKIDIVYYCNAINSVFMIFPRLAGKKVVMNVDGLEWKRAKWNRLGKAAYRVSEYIATVLAHVVIADSRRMQVYYKRKFGKETTLISYGSTGVISVGGSETLKKYGLERRKYFLYVSRLEPENNAHMFVDAYKQLDLCDLPLVIVGDAPYGAPYIEQLRSTGDARVKFLGSIYGDEYRDLISNAYVYLHGNEVGGTNPALLEAMATGNCVLATGVGFNRHVIGEAGYWFRHGNLADLVRKLEFLLLHPDAVEKSRPLAVERMKKNYSWDKVADQYDHLFIEMIRRSAPLKNDHEIQGKA